VGYKKDDKGNMGMPKKSKGFQTKDNAQDGPVHSVMPYAASLGNMKLKPMDNKGYPAEAWRS